MLYITSEVYPMNISPQVHKPRNKGVRYMASKSQRPRLIGTSAVTVPMHTFNTGTVFDLMTGKAVRGHDNKWYITGGLSNHINGLYGINNCFKSTCMDGLAGRVTAIYGADTEIYDTEGSKDMALQDFVRRSGSLGPEIDLNNVVMFSAAEQSLGKIFSHIKEICETKAKNKKDFIIETPFVDIMTGKPQVGWVPTIVYIDSFSEAFSDNEEDLLNKEGIEGGKTQTWAMVDGGKKTVFIRQIRKYCETHGLILICTAHVGGNIDMSNSYLPPPKKSQHMKQSESLKNVGSKFYSLTKTLVNVHSPTILLDGNKEPMYCHGNTPQSDINQVLMKMIRCKSNLSGPSFPMVFSQIHGFLSTVTYYHYLKQNGYRGLVGNKVSHNCAFKPDISLSRNTLREKAATDYELRRAIELCGQMVFLQNYWIPIPELMDTWNMDPNDFWEALSKKHSAKISDILNSRGYWTPNGVGERPYMSIFDVMELLKK